MVGIDVLKKSQSTITEKMAACTFSQDALPMENYWIKMTQDHRIMRNFSRINKSTSCPKSIFQKTSIRFLKDFGPPCITGKIWSRHLFCNGGLSIVIINSDVILNRDALWSIQGKNTISKPLSSEKYTMRIYIAINVFFVTIELRQWIF